MNLSNTACVSEISKSASSCTSGMLSCKASEGGAGGRRVPYNPETKTYIQVYVSYQLYYKNVYTSICQLSIVYRSIYFLDTWYINGIFQSYVDVIHMEAIYIVEHFLVCSIPFFIMIYLWYNLNIKRIFMEYQRYINIKKGKEKNQKCFTMYIPSICMTFTYDWNIPCIYHVYTMYLPCIY